MPARRVSIAGGIDHVLAGGAPMHIARGFGVGPGDVGGQRLDQGNRKIAGFRRGFRQRGEIECPGLAGSLIGPAAAAGMTPVAASARASAASKSSMC